MAVTRKLRENGHEVDIELMKPSGRVRPRMKHIEFRDEIPDMSHYDAVVFGGPVWAFTASPVVIAFIKEIAELKGKKALCFTTSLFPTAVSGAKGGLRKCAALLEDLGATVLEGEMLAWGLWCGAGKIETVAEKIRQRLTS
jgi:hypothetical protein